MTRYGVAVTVLLLAIPAPAAAQDPMPPDTFDLSDFTLLNGVVTGQGVDDPLGEALVYVQGESFSAVTDSLGRYAMPLPEGLWVVSVFHPRAAEMGLTQAPTSMVTAQAGSRVRLDFALDPNVLGSAARPYALDAMEVVARSSQAERTIRIGSRMDVLEPDVLEERRPTARHVGDLIAGQFIGVRVLQYDASDVCIQAPRGAMIRTGEAVQCPGRVAVVLDGSLLDDPGKWIAALSPDNIERVEFQAAVQATTRWGLRGGNGVLYIYTR